MATRDAQADARRRRLYRLRDRRLAGGIQPGEILAVEEDPLEDNPVAAALDARRECKADVGQRRGRRLPIGGGDGEQAQPGADRRGLRARHPGAHAFPARLCRNLRHARERFARLAGASCLGPAAAAAARLQHRHRPAARIGRPAQHRLQR